MTPDEDWPPQGHGNAGEARGRAAILTGCTLVLLFVASALAGMYAMIRFVKWAWQG